MTQERINIENLDFSFLGKNSKITGVFHLVGATHLASDIEGELVMENNAKLCIERSGSFKGTIKCHDIEIYGTFDGTLSASGRAIVYPPATLRGKINAQNLIVYPGATLNVDGHTDN